MKLEYKVKNDKITINQILQNELKISSRLLFKLIKNNRILLKFKALANIQRASMAQMDENLWNAFGGDVLLQNNQDLTITYIVANKLNIALLAALKKGYLRAPIGIGMGYILEVPYPTKIFGFQRKHNTNAIGFSTKNSTRMGTFLTKENLVSVVNAVNDLTIV